MTWNTAHTLYPYQDTAAYQMEAENVLLAFEMGTGKTPTTISAIERVRAENGADFCGKIVVPSSLKFQWAREITKFTDQKTLVIDGPPAKRKAQYESLDPEVYGYVVMSYDSFVRDHDHHHRKAMDFLVLDEATAIKNFKAKRTQHVKKYRHTYQIRFALTGTPIENGNPEEVFSILEWVDPKVLGKFWDFDKRYLRRNSMGWIEGYKNLNEFHRKIKRVAPRRTIKDPEVSKYLPRLIYREPEMCALPPTQAKVVHWIQEALLSDLDAMAENVGSKTFRWEDLDGPPTKEVAAETGQMMAKIQAMRMYLDHPQVLAVSESDFAAQVRDRFPTLLTSKQRSLKLDRLEEYLDDFLDTDPANKAVVFVSFREMARLVVNRCGGVEFNGAMSAKQRDAAKQRFLSDPDVRVFVSTDAGGYGLDLPNANMLINYDLPWQAGLLKQRNARIRRASSAWEHVVVQDFLVKGTIEERVAEVLAHKNALADAVMDGENISDEGDLLSDLNTLRDFLNEWS